MPNALPGPVRHTLDNLDAHPADVLLGRAPRGMHGAPGDGTMGGHNRRPD